MNWDQRQYAIHQSREHGRQLAAFFRAGNEPESRPSPIALYPNERYYHGAPVQVWQWIGGDGTYERTSGVAIGSIRFMAAYYAINAISNASARSRARRDLQPRWRVLGNAVVHLTNFRMAVQGLSVWWEFGLHEVRASECDGEGITLEINGCPPTRFAGEYPDYLFVMFRKLAYGEVVDYGEPRLIPPGSPELTTGE